MINLLEIWNNSLKDKKTDQARNIKRLRIGNDDFTPSIDDKFMQSSFEFTSSMQVVFVSSSRSLKPVQYYDELPSIPMNSSEQKAVEERIVELNKNPRFYDGDQLLIKNVLYDPEKNKIYLEAVKVKYSFLNTLQTRNFPQESSLYSIKLYKTGVIAPFITQDNFVFLMERNDRFKLFSAASGFLEPYGDNKELNPATDDLVVHTARQEALEEFLGHQASTQKSRISFNKPHITSVSLRETENGIGTIEFIAPIQLHCRKENLQRILENNHAKDKHEHTENFRAITLRPEERSTAIHFLQHKKPGSFLYDPILLSTSRFVNAAYHNYKDFIPEFLPNSRTRAFPAKSFAPSLYKQPTLTWQREINSITTSSNESQNNLIDDVVKNNKHRL